MSEYESVNRGWAYVGPDGILRANPNAPHPRTCGICENRWHDGPCDLSKFTSEEQWDLTPPPWWLALTLLVLTAIALLAVLAVML